ncbi:MAG: hypothetical protein L0Y62_07300, partial [Nitrospirae bacterium]|nr:hypothetical protein [Nitrospirota bacterium]
MGANRFYVITSVFILAVLGYLTYNILQPFFSAIAWAAVLTIVFYPVYLYVLRVLKSKFFASSITVIIILLVIIGPVLSLALGLLQELRDLAQSLDNEAIDTIKDIL